MATAENIEDDIDEDILLPEDTNPDHEITDDDPVDENKDDDKSAASEDDTEDNNQSDTSQEGMIPRHRYQSASQRARDAEARVAELEAKIAPEPSAPATDDIDYDAQLLDLDTRQAKMLADGEFENAARLSQEARMIERAQMQVEFEERNTQSANATVEQIRLDRAIEDLNGAYPVLDPDNDGYDQDLVDEVLTLQRAFVASGKNPTQSLYDAVHYARIEGDVPSAKSESRKTDVKKNIDAANKQPPELDKAGFDSNSGGIKDKDPDVTSLTEEEFDALPEATLRRMRGDVN